MKEGQTIGQWLNWDFEANGSLEIKNKKSKRIYWETTGFWVKREYDSKGNYVYYEDSTGVIIDYEDSTGVIIDKRFPEVIEHNGRKYKLMP